MRISIKVTQALERISEVFKVLLWEKAKVHGLSPIQIQILLFIDSHDQELASVSHLAQEFNLTKPTISDAVKTLTNKNLLARSYPYQDNRRHVLVLTPEGKKLIGQLSDLSAPVSNKLDEQSEKELTQIYASLVKLVDKLNRDGIIQVQRHCLGCKHYGSSKTDHYCNLLNIPLHDGDLRLDCPEFETSQA